MLQVDQEKLMRLLDARRVSLNGFAKACGVSRQSIYNMFRGKSVLSVPFEKVLLTLGVGFEEIVAGARAPARMFEEMPKKVKEALHLLKEYALRTKASLYLIGSRARGKKGTRADWDFAFRFSSGKRPDDFVALKNRAADVAFPYPIDIVDISSSPDWFCESIEKDAVPLVGGPFRRPLGRAS